MSRQEHEKTLVNFYECSACDVYWEDEWNCACDDECPKCGKPISPHDSKVIPYEIALECHGIRVILMELDPENAAMYAGGTIESELYDEPEIGEVIIVERPFRTAVNVLESFILAAACAGIDIQSPAFIEAIETVADKIGNEYGE
jgi:hypothetical protein